MSVTHSPWQTLYQNVFIHICLKGPVEDAWEPELDDLQHLFQPKPFYDSMTLLISESGCLFEAE